MALDHKETRKRQRERYVIAVLSLVFVGLTVLEFRLTKVSSSLPFVNSIFFFGLLNLNIIILIALVWLVFRNIGKLFLERRNRILGARLKTKLVVAFIAFAIVPTTVLFIISSLYINSSFDKWFSLKVQNTLQASLEITNIFYKNADQSGLHFAEHVSKLLAKNIAQNPKFQPIDPTNKAIYEFLDDQREVLGLNSVEFYTELLDERIHAYQKNGASQALFYPRLSLDLLQKAFLGEKGSVVETIGAGDLIRSIVLVKNAQNGKALGVLAVNTYIPVSLVSKKDEIAGVFDDYQDTNPLKYPIKTTYFVILIMMTLVIIFVAIWIGLYLARELTVPVERLVHGAEAVGSGNLDVQIDAGGKDEISVLIDSFNKMIRDLKDSRERLSERRIQLETVLANVGTGVLVVDAQGLITTFNRAASQLLELETHQLIGVKFTEILKGEAQPLFDLIEKCLRASNTANLENEVAQWSYQGAKEPKSLAAIATALQDNNINLGVVVVIDDMTMLMKGQREMAWREVARRIAHEIKNPLTPIKLSAQRLQRRLGSTLIGKDGTLLQECTDTIIKHTDELKEMVNEFSNFARFPEIHPSPNNLNEALSEVISLYSQAHAQIQIEFIPEARLPVFSFDRDQIKRVMINLIDNAVAATRNLPKGKIKLETHFNEKLDIAVVMLEDNGAGMDEEVKGRVFEPYFSTKEEGTGLGLAIAKRIINDHNGYIRVQSTPGKGTLFTIELPTLDKTQGDQEWLRMS